MKITELLGNGRITVSMEVFPPKTDDGFEKVEGAVREIAALSPAFVSCTYGAGGGTSKYTVNIARLVKDTGVSSMAHLTCVSSNADTIDRQINAIKEAGIENILALRGDIPEGHSFSGENGFLHASDLIREIRRLYPEACIGGACYPEKHPEAYDKAEDIKNLKLKQEAGCEFLTTQMFFDNGIYYNYMYRLREAGVTLPVIAGIMPVTSRRQMERSIQLSGCTVPPRFKAIVDRFGSDGRAMTRAGIIYATDQIIDLIANGMDHIHIYTMNKPEVAKGIIDNLRELI